MREIPTQTLQRTVSCKQPQKYQCGQQKIHPEYVSHEILGDIKGSIITSEVNGGCVIVIRKWTSRTPWQMLSLSTSCLKLSFRYRAKCSRRQPYPFGAHQSFKICLGEKLRKRHTYNVVIVVSQKTLVRKYPKKPSAKRFDRKRRSNGKMLLTWSMFEAKISQKA